MTNHFEVGDQVNVHFKSLDAARGRKIQIFSGVVIAKKNTGVSRTFTVLKNASAGVKVERIFPLISPLLEKVEVSKKKKRVRRAKLYFLRSLQTQFK